MPVAEKATRRETLQSLGIIAVFIVILSIYLQTNKPDIWRVAPTFDAGKITLHGHEGRFGLIKMNNPGDDLFRAGRGGLYYLYFWGDPEEITGKYKLSATHRDSGQTVQLYEWPIVKGPNDAGATGQSGGRFGLALSGMWKLEISVNGKVFDKMIVDVVP
ncbi:hypothetical protein [Paenibacillus koleovorans]|uniref:hypothetical protein n=1 Tax=Paenibacillus koleovorans TaxID=121608 RepID=UPI000FD82E40|nr:hypothetical protein [Paenibacillus koleovorans]